MPPLRTCLGVFIIFLALIPHHANSAVPEETKKLIEKANEEGPYLGVVTPNLFELKPLLQHPSYNPSNLTIEVFGKRFRFGTIAEEKVILVMTGLAMLNAGITTQLLLSLFNVKGVVHYGIAGNADPSLNLGDVVIPILWSHIGLWSWQRYGFGPENQLPLEASGAYTREIGHIRFANYSTNVSKCESNDNLLNNVWYQQEQYFPSADIYLEHGLKIFWVRIGRVYYARAQSVLGLKLERCVNSTTYLPVTPSVKRVSRGGSANIFVDNAAYRGFLYDKFKISSVDMESAAVALVCLQHGVPFIVFRALSDLAGGGSSDSNEVDTFSSLAANNSVTVVVEFIKLLSNLKIEIA